VPFPLPLAPLLIVIHVPERVAVHEQPAATATVTLLVALDAPNARLVGEMAGDREDREGRPFVGPAGRELNRALEAAEIDRRDVYVTNVVKHFKFEERGKRRIHQTPRKGEIDACMPWLDREIKLIRPTGVVALGATAAKALLGSSFRVTQHRGEMIESDLAPIVAATIHPSAIVRDRDDESRRRERRAFAEDLRAVARAVAAQT